MKSRTAPSAAFALGLFFALSSFAGLGALAGGIPDDGFTERELDAFAVIAANPDPALRADPALLAEPALLADPAPRPAPRIGGRGFMGSPPLGAPAVDLYFQVRRGLVLSGENNN